MGSRRKATPTSNTPNRSVPSSTLDPDRDHDLLSFSPCAPGRLPPNPDRDPDRDRDLDLSPLILPSQHLGTSESQKLFSILCASVPFSILIPHSRQRRLIRAYPCYPWLIFSLYVERNQWREVEKMLGFIVFKPFIIREVEFFDHDHDQDHDHDHDHDDLLRAHPCYPWSIPSPFVPLCLCAFLHPNS